MIFVIASPVYRQTILGTVSEIQELVAGQETKEELYLNKFIKENLLNMGAEQLLIDLHCLMDTDEEILKAVESYRVMYDHTRITILAAGKKPGDRLLQQLFNLGILNIISTDDFVQIKNELKECLTTGKSFKDAVIYKELREDANISTVIEVKQVVSRVMVSLAGSQNRIGTTHCSIVLANYLRKLGYMTALVEYNASGAFAAICEEYEETLFDDTYFSMNGIDFYPAADEAGLADVLAKSYNFVLVDFGSYAEIPQGAAVTFNKGEVRFIVAGSKSWEYRGINENIFNRFSIDSMRQMHFLFSFTPENAEKNIAANMGEIANHNIHFMPYAPDPMAGSAFPDGGEIFKSYFPVKPEKKKRIFGRRK